MVQLKAVKVLTFPLFVFFSPLVQSQVSKPEQSIMQALESLTETQVQCNYEMATNKWTMPKQDSANFCSSQCIVFAALEYVFILIFMA